MDTALVRIVRRFNRLFTQRVGALSESFLGRGRPLSQARVLYEIGPHGADARDLRARLAMDSGYLSRLLQSLERQGLVESQRAARDGRVARITLTLGGRAEVRALNRLSNAFARSLLRPLDKPQRQRLVDAMTDVERLLQASVVEIRVVSPRSKHARWCLEQYYRELATRFSSGFEPSKSISADPRELTPPAGYFLVATLEGKPVGCGALKVTSRDCGEIKRMWVARAARGRGIGRRILSTLEQQARDAGLDILQLETNETLREARSLYRGAGYREVPAFNDEPYAHHWFEKRKLRPRKRSNRVKRPRGRSGRAGARQSSTRLTTRSRTRGGGSAPG
jgi:DNA-binding MarR family transcriptional regulator/GNAT superfamily N-acetyltransferase